jgi:hypothetical protein
MPRRREKSDMTTPDMVSQSKKSLSLMMVVEMNRLATHAKLSSEQWMATLCVHFYSTMTETL